MNNNFWRNGFAIGLVVGVGVCLLLLLSLSNVPVGGSDSTTDWLTSISATVSVLISGIAVLLVAATLKATERTLEETRQLGLNQTRAWILVKSVDVVQAQQEGKMDIRITFCNYGASPARSFDSEIRSYNFPYPFGYALPWEELTSDFAISDLPPGAEFHRYISDFDVPSSDKYRTRVRIRFAYRLLDNSVMDEFVEWVIGRDEGGLHARPRMPIDHRAHATH
ncbi:MAG: hypothetical protein ACRBBT_08585 [Paracoccaceae bacterium]